MSSDCVAQVISVKGTKRTFNPDSVSCFVNDYKAHCDIMKLFKPAEIAIKHEYDPNRSQNSPIVKISVRDSSHFVLLYLKYKAFLQVGGKLFDHNVIPDNINPSKISGLNYYTSKDHQQDILEVLFYGEEYQSEKPMTYRANPHTIEYYELNGKILTRNEVQKLQLKMGSIEPGEIISGKEAVERYGDAKYHSGVRVLRVKDP
jgi:hypothetical protein